MLLRNWSSNYKFYHQFRGKNSRKKCSRNFWLWNRAKSCRKTFKLWHPRDAFYTQRQRECHARKKNPSLRNVGKFTYDAFDSCFGCADRWTKLALPLWRFCKLEIRKIFFWSNLVGTLVKLRLGSEQNDRCEAEMRVFEINLRLFLWWTLQVLNFKVDETSTVWLWRWKDDGMETNQQLTLWLARPTEATRLESRLDPARIQGCWISCDGFQRRRRQLELSAKCC